MIDAPYAEQATVVGLLGRAACARAEAAVALAIHAGAAECAAGSVAASTAAGAERLQHDRGADRTGGAAHRRRDAELLHEAPCAEEAQDLTSHGCISLRLPGGVYGWEFEKGGRELRVRVEGQMIVNGVDELLAAALAGIGLGLVPEDLAASYLKRKQLRSVLDDWCPPFSGFHLYYASRKQASSAFSLVVDALRHRG